MTSPLFAHLCRRLLPPDRSVTQTHSLVGQAAVLILLSESLEPCLLYTKRAVHLRQHAGEVCFPGGMWEPGDENLSATALRETWEEIGLPSGAVRLLGMLEPSQTLAGTRVTPFVASFDADYPLSPNPEELESIFTIPLSRFEGMQVGVKQFERAGRRYQVPIYQDQGYEIWGFTAAVTARLLAHLSD